MPVVDPDSIEEYIKPIYSFIFRLVGNVPDAEDLTQETFLKTWKNIRKFDKNKSFKTWIFTIARNTVTDHFRKKKSIPFSNLDRITDDHAESFESTLQSGELSPEEIFEKREEESVLLMALNSLSLDEKTIIVLRHTDELTFDEISLIMNKPMNTIKSIYYRSTLKLKKTIMHQNGR